MIRASFQQIWSFCCLLNCLRSCGLGWNEKLSLVQCASTSTLLCPSFWSPYLLLRLHLYTLRKVRTHAFGEDGNYVDKKSGDYFSSIFSACSSAGISFSTTAQTCA